MASRFLADAVVGTLMARDRFENCTRDADGFVIDTDECYVPFWFTRVRTCVHAYEPHSGEGILGINC